MARGRPFGARVFQLNTKTLKRSTRPRPHQCLAVQLGTPRDAEAAVDAPCQRGMEEGLEGDEVLFCPGDVAGEAAAEGEASPSSDGAALQASSACAAEEEKVEMRSRVISCDLERSRLVEEDGDAISCDLV